MDNACDPTSKEPILKKKRGPKKRTPTDALPTKTLDKKKSLAQEKTTKRVISSTEKPGQEQANAGDSAAPTKKRRKKKKLRFSNVRPKKAKIEPSDECSANTIVDQSKSPVKRKLQRDREEDPERNGNGPAASLTDALPLTVEHEAPSVESRLLDFTPFQLLLDQLYRILELKDTEKDFFREAATEELSDVQLSFGEIKKKISLDAYRTLAEFTASVNSIFATSIEPNIGDAALMKSAHRLKSIANQLFSQAKLIELSKALPFMKFVGEDQLGFRLADPCLSKTCSQARTLGRRKCSTVDMSSEEVLAFAQQSAKIAAERLASRRAKAEVGFSRQKDDGSTTLNFIDGSLGGSADRKESAMLGSLLPKLTSGTCGISPFAEDKRKQVSTVVPLDYGPFATFGPRYDSTWATLNEAECKLLMDTYGDETTSQYAQSLQAFVKDSDSYLVEMVDGLLDALTNGQHSKAFCAASEQPSAVLMDNIDFDGLRTLESAGINVAFLDDIEKTLQLQGVIPKRQRASCSAPVAKSEKPSPSQLQLASNRDLLSQLMATQTSRLSQKPPFVLTQTLGPTKMETDLAVKIVENLAATLPAAAPTGQLDDAFVVRNLMGVETTAGTEDDNRNRQLPNQRLADFIDMDILREFLHVDGDS